jgi:sugar/nucleoside kinase (ribokinase family)
VSEEIHAFGVAVVGIKLGYRGLYLSTANADTITGMGRAAPSEPARWANSEYWSPPFQVEVVGTTGAGDATIAGFLAALLRDMNPEAALNMATAVGASNVEAADGLSGIRTWDETVARVQAGWAKHNENLDAHGWCYHADTQLWRPS